MDRYDRKTGMKESQREGREGEREKERDYERGGGTDGQRHTDT